MQAVLRHFAFEQVTGLFCLRHLEVKKIIAKLLF